MAVRSSFESALLEMKSSSSISDSEPLIFDVKNKQKKKNRSTTACRVVVSERSVATCIVGPHTCKQAPIVQFCANRVMVVTLICTRGHAHHVQRGRKALQVYGFPIQTYGKHYL